MVSAASFEADFIIVGGGSAGCVLADRLSENGRHTVLLLEAGGDDRPHRRRGQQVSALNIHVPAAFTRVYRDPAFNWNYVSEPEPTLGGRQIGVPRGKVLGGSSSINGMIYARGLPIDFDGWRQLGCAGWSFADVMPFFLRSEDHVGEESAWHSKGGPLRIERAKVTHPVADALLDAIEQAGRGRTDDMNGPQPEGGNYTPLTTRNGLRQSTAVAFLRRAEGRPNLRIVKQAAAEAVLFDGRRASGVRFRQGDQTRLATARREVVLACGAMGSPQLLQLSGVGPAALLARHGIPVVQDSPLVGENLQDHFAYGARTRLRADAPSFNRSARGMPLLGQVARYALSRGGMLSMGGSLTTGYLRSRLDLDEPDVQFFASPATADIGKTMAGNRMIMEEEPGLTFNLYQSRPQSRGHVRIASADPRTAPSILHGYLTEKADQRAAIDAMKLALQILAQPALARYIDHVMMPPAGAYSDEELLAFVRATGSTAFHESGTVAMGGQDRDPLTPTLEVRGVSGLRVADASVMPRIVSGNTNAATIMIAAKAADMMLAASAA